MKNSLSDCGLSNWLVNMVVEWLEKTFFPFTKAKVSRTSGEVYAVNEFIFEAEEISREVQGFYGEIAEVVVKKLRRSSKLKRRLGPQTPADRTSSVSVAEEDVSESEKDKVRASPVVTERTEEERVRQVMECVEGTICDLFYDR